MQVEVEVKSKSYWLGKEERQKLPNSVVKSAWDRSVSLESGDQVMGQLCWGLWVSLESLVFLSFLLLSSPTLAPSSPPLHPSHILPSFLAELFLFIPPWSLHDLLTCASEVISLLYIVKSFLLYGITSLIHTCAVISLVFKISPMASHSFFYHLLPPSLCSKAPQNINSSLCWLSPSPQPRSIEPTLFKFTVVRDDSAIHDQISGQFPHPLWPPRTFDVSDPFPFKLCFHLPSLT